MNIRVHDLRKRRGEDADLADRDRYGIRQRAIGDDGDADLFGIE